MMKHLKLSDPFTKTFPNLTHILAVTQDIPSAKVWYINNFIQIQINADAFSPSLNANFCFGDFLNPFIKCPFIKTQKISKKFLDEYQISLESIIIRSIDFGQYLCIPVDWFYIPCSECYQKKHIAHEILISGYDFESKEVEVTDFFKSGYYSTEKCKVNNLAEAFEQLPTKICILDDNILILDVAKVNYSFNIELAIGLIEDYHFGRNSHYRFNPISQYLDFYSDDLFVFGVNVYDVFLENINKAIEGSIAFLDIRSFHILEQHKVVLAELFKYIYEKGYLANDSFLLDFNEIFAFTVKIKRLAIKFNVLYNIKTLQSIKDYLIKTQLLEKQVFKYVLENIKKKPRLHLENSDEKRNNSIIYISSDSETKGSWIGLYGNYGYDIFFESKTCSDIQLLYYNLFEKVWNKQSDSKFALQLIKYPEQRMEMCKFFKKTAYIDVLITSNRKYEMSIYMLEVCSLERDFEIKFLDGDSDEEIMRFPVKIFADGIYIKFEIMGHIRIEFFNHSNTLGVISGIYFDECKARL